MAMSPLKSSLEGRDLRRSFGQGSMRSTALAGVSIDLYPGQFSLMMGPSGSGKSTLLAILSGLLRPDHGTVHSLGQDIWAMSERQAEGFRLRHVGFIFQGYNLFGAFNAVQQLELVGRWGMNMGYWEARKKARNILDMLGLSKKKHLRPAEMSGGEKQRVAIGRALMKEPELLFADEPTSALDWGTGEQVIELLRGAARERGATVLCVAHDSRIIPFADQVIHLEDGQLKGVVYPDGKSGRPDREDERSHSSKSVLPGGEDEGWNKGKLGGRLNRTA
jgi:putative ABC transport system ATP-binding protein